MLTIDMWEDWVAYNMIEPIGDWQIVYQLAVLCSVAYNMIQNFQRNIFKFFGKRGSNVARVKELAPSDFIPNWGESILDPDKKKAPPGKRDLGRSGWGTKGNLKPAKSVEQMKELFLRMTGGGKKRKRLPEVKKEMP